MRPDIATRRAQAPLPPIQVNTSAPAPGIHTSFDDALLQVKTPNTQRFSLSRPVKPQPAAPAFVISAQPSRPASRPSSHSQPTREDVAASRRDNLQHNNPPAAAVAHAHDPPHRPAQRVRPPPPDAPRTDLLAESQAKFRKPRSSIFSLFSRPNVERARGAGQSDRTVSDLSSLVEDEASQSRRRLSRQPSRAPSRRPSVDNIAESKKSAPSLKSHKSLSSLSAAPVPATLEVPKLPTPPQTMQRSNSSSEATWAPPPLFQAYPQAVKHTTLPLPESSSETSAKKKTPSPPTTAQDRPKSRPGTSRFSRPKSRKDEKERDATVGQSFEAFQSGSASTKIYVLVTTGYLLQYAGDGSFDRLPEKVLQLTAKSAAFASDLIPGKHWVLQVVQSSANDPFRSATSSKSFFSKFSMPVLKRREVSGMLMLFETPEDMDSWMVVIRKEIERINGGRSLRLQTATRRLADESTDQSAQNPLSHRFVALSRSPSITRGPPSPLSPISPTVVDSERTSGATHASAFSDITEWSARDSHIPHKLSSYPADQRSRDRVLEIPEPNQQMPETADIPLSPSSSNDDADFEYLFPPTPGSNRQSTFQPLSDSQPSSPDTYTNAAHYSLSRQGSLKFPTPPTHAPANGQGERRVSTYNLLPASSQRLSRQQSMPALARQSSYPAPTASTPSDSTRASLRMKGSQPLAMESISESTSFFNARASGALPSPPLASPTSTSSLSRASSTYMGNNSGMQGNYPARMSLRAPMSAESLQQSAQAARQNIESADVVARRISARMSMLHQVGSHDPQNSGARGVPPSKSTYTRGTHTSSHNAFALASLPEGDAARQFSRMPATTQSAPSLHSQQSSGAEQPGSANGSANSSGNSSRRTSFRSSGMLLPLQTSINTTSSPNASGHSSWSASQRTSMRLSLTPYSNRQSVIQSTQGAALTPSPTAESKSLQADARQPTSPTTTIGQAARSPGRPMSIQVSSDRAPFLSMNRSPRASVLASSPGPSPLEMNSAPGSMQSSLGNKRESTLVPIVRPPSLANHRLRGSLQKVSDVGLPPQQPPPNVPLPMLPQAPVQRA